MLRGYAVLALIILVLAVYASVANAVSADSAPKTVWVWGVALKGIQSSTVQIWYLWRSDGSKYLYTELNNVKVVFANGTIVTFNAGLYNLTTENMVYRIEFLDLVATFNGYNVSGNTIWLNASVNYGVPFAGIQTCSLLNISISPVSGKAHIPSSVADSNTVGGVPKLRKAGIGLCDNNESYLYVLYKGYSSDTGGELKGKFTIQQWNLPSPVKSVTVTTTQIRTYTATVTEAATTTVTKTVSLAPTETSVPVSAPDPKILAMGAGLVFVLLLIIASIVRR